MLLSARAGKSFSVINKKSFPVHKAGKLAFTFTPKTQFTSMESSIQAIIAELVWSFAKSKSASLRRRRGKLFAQVLPRFIYFHLARLWSKLVNRDLLHAESTSAAASSPWIPIKFHRSRSKWRNCQCHDRLTTRTLQVRCATSSQSSRQSLTPNRISTHRAK